MMLNRKEMISRLESFSGGAFITRKKLAQCMGRKDPHSVDKFLRDLPKVDKELWTSRTGLLLVLAAAVYILTGAAVALQ